MTSPRMWHTASQRAIQGKKDGWGKEPGSRGTQTTPLTRGSPGHRDQGALALRTPARAIVPPTFNHCGSSPQLNLSRKTTIHTLEVCLLDKSIKSTMRVNSHRDDATSILKMYQYILLFTYTKNCILTFKKLIKQNKNRSGPWQVMPAYCGEHPGVGDSSF